MTMELSSNFEELVFFQHHKEDVLRGFIEIAFEYLTNKIKPKSYTNAALKLNSEPVTIEKLIGKLAELLLETVKLKITQPEFVKSIQPILIEEDKVILIWESINIKKELIIQILSKTDVDHLKFSSLNWRLEQMIASKSLDSFQDSNVFIEIQFKNRDGKQHSHFVADIPNLFHMTDLLERALNETKASHIRKIQCNK